MVFIVLPVFNEEPSLGPLLERFEAVARGGVELARVVVVDDGSRDASAAVAESFRKRLPLELLRHDVNQGLGRTIQDGLLHAASLAGPADAVVTMDADCTHPPEIIPRMLAALDAGADVVIASRYRRGARVRGLSPFRVLMSYGARAAFRLLRPVCHVRDYTCGFRAYRAGVLQRAIEASGGVLAHERGFASMAEILFSLAAVGARFHEVPFVLDYGLKRGASKMPVGATVARILRLAAGGRLPPPAPPKPDPDHPGQRAHTARPE